jgi:hypothetical protein
MSPILSIHPTCQSTRYARIDYWRRTAEKHDVSALMLHYRRVVDRFHLVGDFCLGEDGIVAISPDNIRLHDYFFSSKSKIVE